MKTYTAVAIPHDQTLGTHERMFPLGAQHNLTSAIGFARNELAEDYWQLLRVESDDGDEVYEARPT